MAGWILTIDQHHPQHLGYALEHGFWDTATRTTGLRSGDDLFFWQAGASRLVAHCRATTALDPIGVAPQPWDDTRVRDYKYRVYLTLISQEVTSSPSYGELRSIIENNQIQGAVKQIHRSAGIDELAARFKPDVAASSAVELDFDPTDWLAQDDDLDRIPDDQDDRRSAVREVKLRQGQTAFRSQLLRRYERCLITCSSVRPVLDAAHISPYRGTHTNQVTNGLLLRTDIHTLFDLNLLTVTPDYVVRVSPDLAHTAYEGLDSDSLTFPHGGSLRPDPDRLTSHNANCSWL